MYVFLLLLCCFNFNYISDSLDQLDIFHKEKSRKGPNFGQLVTIIAGTNL